ncbi:hypothetical protein V8E54_014997, partial [Elaphomyces granulatus]
MADGPRRVRPVPTKGDRWRHETVQGHISAPVTTPRTRRRDPSPSDQTPHGHISVPVTTPRTRRRDPSPLVQTLDDHIATPIATQSDLSQQRKRRRVQAERPDSLLNPAKALLETYNRR